MATEMDGVTDGSVKSKRVNKTAAGAAEGVLSAHRRPVINLLEIERIMGANSDAYKLMAYINSHYVQHLPDQAYNMLTFTEMSEFLAFDNSLVDTTNHLLYKRLHQVEPQRALAMAAVMHAAWGPHHLRFNKKYRAVVEANSPVFSKFPSLPCPDLDLATRVKLYKAAGRDRRKERRVKRRKEGVITVQKPVDDVVTTLNQVDNVITMQKQVGDDGEVPKEKRQQKSDKAIQVDETAELVAAMTEFHEMHRQTQGHLTKVLECFNAQLLGTTQFLEKITHVIGDCQTRVDEHLNECQRDIFTQVQDSPCVAQIQQRIDKINHRIDVISRHMANS